MGATLRWRIHAGDLLLRQRHLRALRQMDLPEPLLGWIHERLEWAMLNMLEDKGEAVLVLDIDPKREARISLDNLREAPMLTVTDLRVVDGLVCGLGLDDPALASDSAAAADRSLSAHVGSGQPYRGDIWVERDSTLCASCSELASATATLCSDLANTLNFPVEIKPQRSEDVEAAANKGGCFFISDEFGLVPVTASDQQTPAAAGEAPISKRLREAFAKLYS
ncbi:MAG: hypothetical protein FWF71_01505 [Actinomycetia bacterium]|nr:hypothetical protein [Actinomycetes bacterium]